MLVTYQTGVRYEESPCTQTRYFSACSILFLYPGNQGGILPNSFSNIASQRRYDDQVGCGNLRQLQVRLCRKPSTVQIGMAGNANQMHIKNRFPAFFRRMIIRPVKYVEKTYDAV